MYRLVLLTSLSVAWAVECPVRLLYSNETQAQSVDKHNNAVLSRTKTLGVYYEPATARCWSPPDDASITCSSISKPPYLGQYTENDRTLIVFMTAHCASLHSEWDNYTQLGKDEYLAMGSICRPIAPGIECFDEKKLDIVGS